MSSGKLTIGLEGGISTGISKSSSEEMSMSEEKSELGTGEGIGRRIGCWIWKWQIRSGWGVEIGLGDDGLDDGGLGVDGGGGG